MTLLALGCTLSLAVSLPTPVTAEQLHVPGDYTTVQAALDAAAPDATIHIHGGTHTALSIEKPVALIGYDGAQVVTDANSCFPQAAAITLSGLGQGRVALRNISTSGNLGPNCQPEAGPGIEGGDFDELVLVNCHIEPADPYQPGGYVFGTPAIRVSVPSLIVSDSTVLGSYSGDTGGDFYGTRDDGPPAIDAPNSTVTIVRSTVRGGDHTDIFMLWFAPPSAPPLCPCDPSVLGIEGNGGPAVIANELFQASSTLTGGSGGTLVWSGDFTGDYGQQTPGAAFDAEVNVELYDPFPGAFPATVGQPWGTSWTTTSAAIALLISAPVKFGPGSTEFGWLYTNPITSLFVLPSPWVFTADLPNDMALAGRFLAVQLWDPVDGLSAPLFDVIQVP